MVDDAGPAAARVPDQRAPELGFGDGEVDASAPRQVADRALVGHRAGVVLPGEGVDLERSLRRDIRGRRCRRDGPGPGQPHPGCRRVVEERDRVTEPDAVKPADEVDDVAGGAATEAVEPVRHPAHGQGRGGVVVEGAAPQVAATGGPQLDAGVGDDILDPVPGPDRSHIHQLAAGHGCTPNTGRGAASICRACSWRWTSMANCSAGIRGSAVSASRERGLDDVGADERVEDGVLVPGGVVGVEQPRRSLRRGGAGRSGCPGSRPSACRSRGRSPARRRTGPGRPSGRSTPILRCPGSGPGGRGEPRGRLGSGRPGR